ncbi:MAG TPA: peptide-methionine (S)-S-oxide reductase, partial [Casimicrobiaceae bacterium]
MARRIASVVAACMLMAVQACGAASGAVVLPAPTVDIPAATAKGPQTAVFAGGCFWGVEAVFRHVKG